MQDVMVPMYERYPVVGFSTSGTFRRMGCVHGRVVSVTAGVLADQVKDPDIGTVNPVVSGQ